MSPISTARAITYILNLLKTKRGTTPYDVGNPGPHSRERM